MPNNSYIDSENDRKGSLPNSPAVWAAMAKEAKEFDQDNVRRGKGDVDILLVFVSTYEPVSFVYHVLIVGNLHV